MVYLRVADGLPMVKLGFYLGVPGALLRFTDGLLRVYLGLA